MRPNQVISVPSMAEPSVGVVNPRRGKVLMSIVRVWVPPILISRLISDTDRARVRWLNAEVNHEISRAEFVDASKEMLSRSHKRKATPNTKCRSCGEKALVA